MNGLSKRESTEDDEYVHTTSSKYICLHTSWKTNRKIQLEKIDGPATKGMNARASQNRFAKGFR